MVVSDDFARVRARGILARRVALQIVSPIEGASVGVTATEFATDENGMGIGCDH